MTLVTVTGGVVAATEGIGVMKSQTDLSTSFRDFYEGNYPSLFGAMCLVTGNRADAEELVQDAFLKLWERWDRVAVMDSPVGYLYRTAMNAFRCDIDGPRPPLVGSRDAS
jgi:DNA-directed RNA polymerase specialized sigma24 family protein